MVRMRLLHKGGDQSEPLLLLLSLLSQSLIRVCFFLNWMRRKKKAEAYASG